MDVQKGQDVDEIEDAKLQKACVWGEHKFCRMVVCIGMLLWDCFRQAPANVTDEAIDEAFAARDKIIKCNMQCIPGIPAHHLSFRTHKALNQTIVIRA